MRASAIEFRFRMAIITVMVTLGFWAPWIEPLRLGTRISLLEWLALELSRTGLVGFTAATPMVIALATLCAAVAVVLRVWGTAYLGPGVVNNFEMKAGAVMADGPFRYLRNPLYAGVWFMLAAVSFIMPVSGAVVAMLLVTLFLVRLTLGEEAFLTAQLGSPYLAYQRAVPRFIPRLRSGLPHAGHTPHWGNALVAELNPIGVFVIFAALSWSYDNRLMIRAIIICLGISMVVRALLPSIRQSAA